MSAGPKMTGPPLTVLDAACKQGARRPHMSSQESRTLSPFLFDVLLQWLTEHSNFLNLCLSINGEGHTQEQPNGRET